MCTVVILRRPGHDWPLILAANRDEMTDRPWDGPARHWPDRPEVVAGRDRLAGGTWLGLNRFGVVAGILNRRESLGPRPGFRSRGELPLEALDHAEAAVAAAALSHIETRSYRSFNMVIADNRDAFWLRWLGTGVGRDDRPGIEVKELPPGISMITAFDLDDPDSPRIGTYLPRFREATPPDPDGGVWTSWSALMAYRVHAPGAGPGGAMTVVTDHGFATVSSSLVALPGPGRTDARPVWRFAAGPPGEFPYAPVAL